MESRNFPDLVSSHAQKQKQNQKTQNKECKHPDHQNFSSSSKYYSFEFYNDSGMAGMTTNPGTSLATQDM